jgi:ribonuclease P protein component
MNINRLTFPKNERLSGKRHIDRLFLQGLSFVVFPLKAIYLPVDKEAMDAAVSVLISVPKKKIKHAVDRHYIKRRVSESYRLRKRDLLHFFAEKEQKLLLAFIYIHREKVSFAKIDRAMGKVIQIIQKKTG